VVDLAGSERVKRSGATGSRLTEATTINRSLLALGRVVSALTQNPKARQAHDTHPRPNSAAGKQASKSGRSPNFVPYRGSLLTRLLASALGGNSRTALVACISPAADSASETCETLRFAARATFVKNSADSAEEEVSESVSPLSFKEETLLELAARNASDYSPFDLASSSCIIPPEGVCASLEVYGDFSAGPQAPVIL
jgi:hypothetical protein